MAFAMKEKARIDTQSAPIGETDWSDPASVAQCAAQVWKLNERGVKLRAEAQAYRNMAFVNGDQWWQWNREQRRMEDPRVSLSGHGIRKQWERLLTYNRLPEILEIKLSKLTRQDTRWKCFPVTDDDNDVAIARTSSDVLDGYWRQVLDMDAKTARAIFLAMVVKTLFLEVMWDPNAGDDASASLDQFLSGQAPDDLTADPMEAARAAMAERYGEEAARNGVWQGKTGDVRIELAPIFEVNVWPTNVMEFADADIIQRTVVKSAAQVADELGMSVSEVRALGKSKQSEDFHSNRVSQSRWMTDYSDTSAENDGIMVHRTFRKACGEYPKGMMAITIGTECVRLQENPYRGRIPIYAIQERFGPDNLWGRCTVDELVDPQRDLNIAASQESAHRNFASHPLVIRFKGDTMNDSDFTTAPGGVAKCASPDLAPTILERAQLGTEHGRTMERNLSQMREISGVGQVDYGTTEGSNPKSGRGISALQEQNDARLTAFGKNIDRAMGDAGEAVLEMLQDFASDDRVVQFIGEENKLEVVRFKAESLRPSTYGQPGKRTAFVRVESFRNLPTTKSELRETLQAFVDTGALNPADPNERALLFELWGGDSVSKLTDRFRKDQQRQTAEIDMWMKGEMVGPPNESDAHEVHLRLIGDWKKTQDYRYLLRANPQLEQDITEHEQLHRDGLAQNQIQPIYEQYFAHIQMWLKYQARAATIDPRLAQFFAAPLIGGGPPPGGGQGGGEPPSDGKMDKIDKMG